ncbi:MAG: 3-deoxy-manno-octulosonate cytidylyltransferase [candidate division Zixibacteria bacterium]|nr:3-deoxy-manno-octulosonate cytidylyltransferase [candidate division Zixibacteria bacterium]
MKATVTAVIPARLGSSRFPGKALHPYLDKPLLFYVWNDLRKVKSIDRLVVATDDLSISKAAKNFGAEVVKTSAKHRSGSDRAAEAARKVGGDIILNVQGDNFGLRAKDIDNVITLMKKDRKITSATFAQKIISDADLFDPNKVKVIFSRAGYALWFSRFPLPYLQSAYSEVERNIQFNFWAHIGVYFFRKQTLSKFAATPRTSFEMAESLEQLRLLEFGERMKVFKTTMTTVSIDQPGDVKKINSLYKNR